MVRDGSYSYLNASMGLSFAAFFAGYTPKNIPTRAEKLKARDTDQTETDVGSAGKRMVREKAIPVPMTIPIIPPMIERVTASIKN